MTSFELCASGDLVGKALAFTSLFPMWLFVVTGTLELARRELHAVCVDPSHVDWQSLTVPRQISLLAGMLINEAVNLAVKNIVQEPRPARGASAACPSYE